MMKTGAAKVGLPRPGLQERVRQGSLTSSSSAATPAAMRTSRSSNALASDQRLSRVSHKSAAVYDRPTWLVSEGARRQNVVRTDIRFCFSAEKSQQRRCSDKACTRSRYLPDEEDCDHRSHLRSCRGPPPRSVR